MKEEKKTERSGRGLSRRDFLKSSAVIGAVGLGAGTLSGCTSGTSEGGGSASNGYQWDKIVDVLAVGSSGASYGALAAKDAGAESVMIIEKGHIFGGAASLSGGGHWAPCNHVMAELGYEDNRDDALTYIDYLACGQSTPELQASYVDNTLAFVDWTMEKFGYVWDILLKDFGISQDYAPDTTPGVRVYGRSIAIDDVQTVKNVMGEDIEHSFLVAANEFRCVRHLCEQNGIEIMMETAGTKLITDDDGGVIGAVAVDAEGNELLIGVNKGVILGTGGFDCNGEMVKAFLRLPYYSTCLLPTCTGDGHRMGMEIGANLANMSSVYGCACFEADPPNEDGSMISNPTMDFTNIGGVRGKPNSLIVNSFGNRVGNESTAYGNFIHALEAWSTTTLKPEPTFFICDTTFVEHYSLGSGVQAIPVGEIPNYIVQADTLEELAEKLGIDYAGLEDTLAVFNPNAEAGIDPIWHRGEYHYDQADNGDRTETRTDLKNNCLGPVKTPPFYGAKVLPGTLGTSGGLKINGKAQVLDTNNDPIPGLFACGCTASSPFGPAYPGGGSPVGSTCTFGYVAGRAAMGGETK